jgi:hypothetical protein
MVGWEYTGKEKKRLTQEPRKRYNLNCSNKGPDKHPLAKSL